MKKGVNKRIDEGTLQGFSHVERLPWFPPRRVVYPPGFTLPWMTSSCFLPLSPHSYFSMFSCPFCSPEPPRDIVPLSVACWGYSMKSRKVLSFIYLLVFLLPVMYVSTLLCILCDFVIDVLLKFDCCLVGLLGNVSPVLLKSYKHSECTYETNNRT